MHHTIIQTILALTLVSLCLGTQARNLDNEYLRFGRQNHNGYMRFGRQNYNGYMRFGRAIHVPDEDSGNNLLVTSGNGDGFQSIDQQEPNPLQTIASLNELRRLEDGLPESVPASLIARRSREPFLRFGRAVPYLRFGKKSFPYPRFGRNFPSVTNQAGEAFRSSENSQEALLRLDDAATLLTGSRSLGEDSESADRKKRSVETQVAETQAPVKGGVAGTDVASSVADKPSVDQVKTREIRSKTYMRFGKKSGQTNSDNHPYSWDKQIELYIKKQADKRKQEYMRFGRSKQNNTM